MKHLSKLAAAAVLAALPFSAQAAKDSVTVAMTLEPPGLDPTTGAAAAIAQITLYNIYEGLTRINEDATVSPMLAESWTVSDDGKVYTFALRKGDPDALNFFSNWILVNINNGWLKERHDHWFKTQEWADQVALEQ